MPPPVAVPEVARPTVTLLASVELKVAVTVETTPFSPIEAGFTESVTVGRAIPQTWTLPFAPFH